MVHFQTKDDLNGVLDACKIRDAVQRFMLECKTGKKKFCSDSFVRLEEQINKDSFKEWCDKQKGCCSPGAKPCTQCERAWKAALKAKGARP